jgi:hypothetical protein
MSDEIQTKRDASNLFYLESMEPNESLDESLTKVPMKALMKAGTLSRFRHNLFALPKSHTWQEIQAFLYPNARQKTGDIIYHSIRIWANAGGGHGGGTRATLLTPMSTVF